MSESNKPNNSSASSVPKVASLSVLEAKKAALLRRLAEKKNKTAQTQHQR